MSQVKVNYAALQQRMRCHRGTRVENECPPMCIWGTTQCADNAAGSYLGSTLLTRTSNASQLFRVALTYTQYFASQLFRVSALLNIHTSNAQAYTVYLALHPIFCRDTEVLNDCWVKLLFYTVCVSWVHPGFSRISSRVDTTYRKSTKDWKGIWWKWTPYLSLACGYIRWTQNAYFWGCYTSVWRSRHNFLTLQDW